MGSAALEGEARQHLPSSAELLYQHWHNGGKTIVISSKITRAARLSARSKSNALAEIQRLGLIDVDRRAGRAPRVIMLHVPVW